MGLRKIIGKFLGNKVATVVFGEKVVTVQGADKVEAVKAQVQEYQNNPTPELEEKINQTLNAEKIKQATVIEKQVSQLESQEKELQTETQGVAKQVAKTEKGRTALRTSTYIDYDEDKQFYYLKGFDARIPMPEPLVDQLADNERKKISNQNLLNFWMLCMGLKDARARFDMFKYLVRQKLIISDNGFFVTFRRWVPIKSSKPSAEPVVLKGDLDELSRVLHDAAGKIKKWKQSPKNYSVVLKGDKHDVVPTKKLPVGEDSDDFRVIGMFKEMYDAMVSAEQPVAPQTPVEHVQWYTDAHTKSFKMRIGHAVKMPREKCNNNPKQDCSYGLHVGTPDFVSGGGFGDTIVACLVNPLHVVSVPYANAHKMRVCEYFPFKVVTMDEVRKFSQVDLTQYEQEYMNFEWEELQKQLNDPNSEVYDDGTLMNGVDYKRKTPADLKKLHDKLSAVKSDINKTKAKKDAVLNGDPINPELSTADMKTIIASRTIKNK